MKKRKDFQHCACPNYTFVDGGTEYYRYGGMDMNKILLFNPDGSSYIAGKQEKSRIKKTIVDLVSKLEIPFF